MKKLAIAYNHLGVLMIRLATNNDSAEIAAIYNYYVRETVVTFEEEEVTDEQMLKRITDTQQAGFPWFVAQDSQGNVIGYAYANKWRERYSYRFSVEVTVYLSVDQSGHGIGSKLYAALFDALKAQGIHSVIGGITLPNQASVALHEKFGLEQVANFKQVGYKLDRWLDVGYWQGWLK